MSSVSHTLFSFRFFSLTLLPPAVWLYWDQTLPLCTSETQSSYLSGRFHAFSDLFTLSVSSSFSCDLSLSLLQLLVADSSVSILQFLSFFHIVLLHILLVLQCRFSVQLTADLYVPSHFWFLEISHLALWQFFFSQSSRVCILQVHSWRTWIFCFFLLISLMNSKFLRMLYTRIFAKISSQSFVSSTFRME